MNAFETAQIDRAHVTSCLQQAVADFEAGRQEYEMAQKAHRQALTARRLVEREREDIKWALYKASHAAYEAAYSAWEIAGKKKGKQPKYPFLSGTYYDAYSFTRYTESTYSDVDERMDQVRLALQAAELSESLDMTPQQVELMEAYAKGRMAELVAKVTEYATGRAEAINAELVKEQP